MSDLDNAGNRPLSSKYTPTEPTPGANHPAADDNVDDDRDDDEAHTRSRRPPSDEEQGLPLHSSPAFDATPAPEIDQSLPTSCDTETHADSVPDAEEKATPGPNPPAASFHLFADLPAELRIKIWHLSLLPRVVELHPTRPNYARDSTARQQQWQSGCSNPASLSVSPEARQVALSHFRIAYPLASITSQEEEVEPQKQQQQQQQQISTTYNFSGPSATGRAIMRRRTLYISPEADTVALLGLDSDFSKLSALLGSLRAADPLGRGISSLALSKGGWGGAGSAAVIKSLGRTILRDLGQLTLFMYGEPLPPYDWNANGASLDEESLRRFRRAGNRCELVSCEGSSDAWYAYRLWSGGEGRQFWDGEGRIMRVGRNDLRIMDLEFSDGW